MKFGDVKVGELFTWNTLTLIRVYNSNSVKKTSVIIEPVERRGEWFGIDNDYCSVRKPSVPFKDIKVDEIFNVNDVEYRRVTEFGGYNVLSHLGAAYFSDDKKVERI